jgi:general secretion pathway protein J
MMTRRLDLRGVQGFTLLEALIATALMGMILAALSTVAAQWVPNWNRGFAQVQRYEIVALGLERAIADLSAAEFVLTDQVTRRAYFDGTDKSVIFVRTILAPGAGPGLEVVRIAEMRAEGGPILVRTRAPFHSAKDHRYEASFNDPVVLIRAPQRVSFSYAGPDRVWRSDWRGERQLPRVIQLTLRDEAANRRIVLSTSAIVHAEIPAECILAQSKAECIAARLQPPGSPDRDKSPESSVGGQR